MAAVLTEAELDFARGLQLNEIPNRLRCANCNRPVFEAMKTDCCDTSICKTCSEKLSKACPACAHPITSEMTREDKRTRITLKAHIKGELQKRNNAKAAALAAAAAQEKAEAEVSTPTVADSPTTPPVQTSVEAAPEPEIPAAEVVPAVSTDANMADDGEENGEDDDHDSVEIITEAPEAIQEAVSLQDQEAEDAAVEETGDDQEQDQSDYPQDNGQGNGYNTGMANNMNFSNPAAFNPMMGMGMAPFGMMPGMMGMPGMGMDPSMMFNGGFAGMNGMANMMNGNMMGGNYGMGDTTDFSSYNHQYGNRFDDRSSFQSNRGYGRGGYGQNYRGRGQGFRGRGRGGWNNQYQSQHNYQTNQSFSRDKWTGQPTEAEATAGQNGDAPVADGTAADHGEQVQSEPPADREPESKPSGEYIEDEVDYDDDALIQQRPTSENATNANGTQDHEYTRQRSPPRNAPTGPKAMREGLPNSGRFSRANVSSDVHGSGPGDAVAAEPRPGSSSSFNRHDAHSRHKDSGSYAREARDSRGRHGDDRSRSRSVVKRDDDRDKHSSKADKHDDRRSERYSREQSADADYQKRKDRKRSRNYDDERSHRKEKRSRSRSPEDSSRRHRSHRDEKDRSRRDRSRDKHRSGRDREHDAEDDDHRRHKSKSHKSSSRREREDYDDRKDTVERRSDTTAHPSRTAPVAGDDDIGFRIKGSKSRESKSAAAEVSIPTGPRDPYAEERERMKAQRLEKDAQRRQGSGKRDREDDDGGEDRQYGKKKRSRPRAKYEGEIENHEHERESRRWR